MYIYVFCVLYIIYSIYVLSFDKRPIAVASRSEASWLLALPELQAATSQGSAAEITYIYTWLYMNNMKLK